jgi:hypothetical protein
MQVLFYFFRKGWILLIQKSYNQPPNWPPLNKQNITQKSSTGATSAHWDESRSDRSG